MALPDLRSWDSEPFHVPAYGEEQAPSVALTGWGVWTVFLWVIPRTCEWYVAKVLSWTISVSDCDVRNKWTTAWKNSTGELEIDFSKIIMTLHLRLFLGPLKTTSITIFFWNPMEQCRLCIKSLMFSTDMFWVLYMHQEACLSWSTLKAKISFDTFDVLQ